MPPETTNEVELSSIDKRFGSVRALEHASLSLRPGKVHAVVGENGAGKSTLLKIAAGCLVADRGSVVVAGSPLSPATPREAIRRGVGMVHQHFMLVPTLTGLENLALGDEPSRFGVLHLAPLAEKSERVARELGLSVRLDVPVSELGVGERQRLEIVRVLSRGVRVLVLDEPTAVLSPAEARTVLSLARRIAAEGVAVALVTHRLDEVAEHADEVTVLRRGRVVAFHAEGDPMVRDVRRLAREALGDEPMPTARRAGEEGALRHSGVVAIEGRRAPALRLAGFSVAPQGAGGEALHEATLEVDVGEIVGVAGVEGNGQRPLELAIAGLADGSGAMTFGGDDVAALDPRARRRAGLAWIPSDRHEHGLAGDLPAIDSLGLGGLDEVATGPFRLFVDEDELARRYARAVAAFELRPPDPGALTRALSGGNQQKLVVARELGYSTTRVARVILAAQPTRGVDARASTLVRARLLEAARKGAGVLVISSDLSELREIADRIVVLRGGRIVAELPPDADVDTIGAAMLGGAP